MIDEIPIESEFPRFIDVSSLNGADTGRRFNKYNNHLLEEEKGTPEYESASFGEYIFLPPTNGKYRIQKITILYARIAKTSMIYCS